MKIERCEYLIDSFIEDEIINNTIYKKSIYIHNKKEKIATLLIDKNIDICKLSFIWNNEQISKEINNITELYGIYFIYNENKDILYCIKIDKNIQLNSKTLLNKFKLYHERVMDGDIDFVLSLLLYIDLSDKLEMVLLLYCLIFSMNEIKLNSIKIIDLYDGYTINLNVAPCKLNFDWIDYISKKFEYYGYDINDKRAYKINFEKKLNTSFSLGKDLSLNSNAYYEMFFELFKYLFDLKTEIDVEKYVKSSFYNKIKIYFENFIKLLKIEKIIS